MKKLLLVLFLLCAAGLGGGLFYYYKFEAPEKQVSLKVEDDLKYGVLDEMLKPYHFGRDKHQFFYENFKELLEGDSLLLLLKSCGCEEHILKMEPSERVKYLLSLQLRMMLDNLNSLSSEELLDFFQVYEKFFHILPPSKCRALRKQEGEIGQYFNLENYLRAYRNMSYSKTKSSFHSLRKSLEQAEDGDKARFAKSRREELMALMDEVYSRYYSTAENSRNRVVLKALTNEKNQDIVACTYFKFLYRAVINCKDDKTRNTIIASFHEL